MANVELIDAVPYAGIAPALANAGICVFPSVWEASGFVCKEAMSAARAVIASDAGGMAEIIDHGRTGLLIPPRDPRALAAAIIELLRDPVRRTAIGLAAREHITAAFAPEVIAPLQEAIYLRAIQRREALRGDFWGGSRLARDASAFCDHLHSQSAP